MILSRILMVLALAVLAYMVYMTINPVPNTNEREASESKKTTDTAQIKKENFTPKRQEQFQQKQNKPRNVEPRHIDPEPRHVEPRHFDLEPEQFVNQHTHYEPEHFMNQRNHYEPEHQHPRYEPEHFEPRHIEPEHFVNRQPKNVSFNMENFEQSQSPAVPVQNNTNNLAGKINRSPTFSANANIPPANLPNESVLKIKDDEPVINYDVSIDVSGFDDNNHNAAPFGGNSSADANYATVKYSGLVDGTPGDVIQIEGTDLLTAPLVDNMLYTNSISNTNRNASNDLRGDIPLQFNDSFTPFYSSTIYGAPLSQHTMTIGKL